MYCKNCGNKLKEETKFCPKCGVLKGNGDAYCDECGAQVLSKDGYCQDCGKALFDGDNAVMIKNDNAKQQVHKGKFANFMVYKVATIVLSCVLAISCLAFGVWGIIKTSAEEQNPPTAGNNDDGSNGENTTDDGDDDTSGADNGETKSLQFTLGFNGTYYMVSGIGNCDGDEIVIPSTYSGKPVKAIGDNAFKNYTSFNKITIPDSVTSIGNSAFAYCTSLTSITIGSSVTSIGNSAFRYCDSLTEVIIANSVASSVASIGSYAFADCTSLTSATIGNGVTSIGMCAFYNCTTLKSITIPSTVTNIGGNPSSDTCGSTFQGCVNLERVDFDGTIDQWAQITFTRDGGSSILDYTTNPLLYAHNLYIQGELVTEVVLTTATKISSVAFQGCTSITRVVIPATVVRIGDYAFSGCANLTSAVIEVTDSWKVQGTYINSDTILTITSTELSDDAVAAGLLNSSYATYTWDKI